MRLRNSVVLYKNTPVYINEIIDGTGDDILRVRFQELPIAGAVPAEKRDAFGRGPKVLDRLDDAPDKRKYISSKHFDIAPFRLGYVNSPKGAFYCSRMPNRVQKQGLCGENFTAKTNNGTVISFQTFLSCEESVAMVKGEYPTFDQALKALAKCPAVAFDREFCLVKDEVFPELITYLYHKGAKIGMFNKEELSLGQKFKCLKEQLQEMKIKVGVA